MDLAKQKQQSNVFHQMVKRGCGVVLATLLTTIPVVAEPLRVEGREQLFQRVLVRETGTAFDTPGGQEVASTLPLQAFYVFEHQDGFIRVATAANATEFYWISEDETVPWRQNIVAVFENTSQVERVLLLESEDNVLDLVESEAPGLDAAALRETALTNSAENEQVIALGPEETIDQRTNLYVLPILQNSREFFESGISTNVLEVAVVRQNSTPSAQTQEAAPVTEGFQAGVVFVVDTTVSMQPFIEATRDAISGIYDQIEAAGLSNSISFGVLGFRDNLSASPGLEYATRKFVSFDDGVTREGFVSGINRMQQASVSSVGFDEDSFTGIREALSQFDWAPFHARYLVLVTDAGPRLAEDELSGTGLSPEGLNNVVTELSGASVFVLHLKTDSGTSNHAAAEEAYRRLSQRPNEPGYYFDVPGGDPQIYRAKAIELAEAIIGQVGRIRGTTEQIPEVEDEDSIAAAISSSSRMMELAYLGNQNSTVAPDVFRAWISDRDYEQQNKKTLSIRLLINKSQLSDLSQAIERIITLAEENVLSPDQFFRQILSASASMSRRPEDVTLSSESTIASTAQIADYLEGLPYTSRIMKITEDDWIRMSISEQQMIINSLYDKLHRFREYNAATDIWVDYLGNGIGSERAYPMRLDDLP